MLCAPYFMSRSYGCKKLSLKDSLEPTSFVLLGANNHSYCKKF